MPAVFHPLPEIPYLRLRAQFRSLGETRLPAFKGSMFRGAFGRALRAAVCAMGPGQACESCSLGGPCVYTRIFETFVDGRPSPFLEGLDTSPRPHVFEPLSDGQELAPSELVETDLLLFGASVELQAYAVLALSRMAAKGFGRDRHPFALDGVSVLEPSGGWTVGLDGSDGVASWSPVPPRILAPVDDRPSPERITLRFLTPTRVQSQSPGPRRHRRPRAPGPLPRGLPLRAGRPVVAPGPRSLHRGGDLGGLPVRRRRRSPLRGPPPRRRRRRAPVTPPSTSPRSIHRGAARPGRPSFLTTAPPRE